MRWIRTNDPDHPLNTDDSPVRINNNGDFIPFQSGFVYLGSAYDSKFDVCHSIKTRVSLGYRAWGALKCILCSRTVWLSTKTKIFKTCVVTVLLHGCESWLITKTAMKSLQVFFNNCTRWMCGFNRLTAQQQGLTNNAILKRLRLQPLEFYLRRRQLRWLGSIARMSKRRLPRLLFAASPEVNGTPLNRSIHSGGRASRKSVTHDALHFAKINQPSGAGWSQSALDANKWHGSINAMAPFNYSRAPRRQNANATINNNNNIRTLPQLPHHAPGQTLRRSARLQGLAPR